MLESMGELGKTRHPFPDIQVSGRLKGRELAVRFKWFEVNKHVVEFDDVWKLSPDGNTLSIDRASELRPIPIEVGQHHEVFVFERAKRGVK